MSTTINSNPDQDQLVKAGQDSELTACVASSCVSPIVFDVIQLILSTLANDTVELEGQKQCFFSMIPSTVIASMILTPFLSLEDIARLEVSMTNKSLRRHFSSGNFPWQEQRLICA